MVLDNFIVNFHFFSFYSLWISVGNLPNHVCSLKINFHAFFPYNILHGLDISLPLFNFSYKWLTIFRPKRFFKKSKKNMFDVCILFGHQILLKDYFFFTHMLIACISHLTWVTNHWFTQSGVYKVNVHYKNPRCYITIMKFSIFSKNTQYITQI